MESKQENGERMRKWRERMGKWKEGEKWRDKEIYSLSMTFLWQKLTPWPKYGLIVVDDNTDDRLHLQNGMILDGFLHLCKLTLTMALLQEIRFRRS